MKNQKNKNLIALDVGERRIGVAVASLVARLPRPWGVILQTEDVFKRIQELIAAEHVAGVVVGLPRGMNSQETAQTKYVRGFTKSLEANIIVPVYWCDEALTSKSAEAELRQRKTAYTKGDIDTLAACYILNDFLLENNDLMPRAAYI